MIEFRMPSLGADMDAGTLTEWLKKPGDIIKHGDITVQSRERRGKTSRKNRWISYSLLLSEGMVDTNLRVSPLLSLAFFVID